jgi:hypothetical protein
MSYGANGGTLTTTVPGTLVLGFGAWGFDIGTAQWATLTCATVNDLTKEFDLGTGLGTGGGIMVWSGIKPSAGAVVDTGANNFTAVLANSTAYAMLIMALKPANPNGPFYIGKGTATNGLAAQTTTLDFIYAAGDLLVCVVQTGFATTTISGWTQVDSINTGTDAVAGSLGLYVFYKRAASSSETDPVVNDSGDHQVAQVFGFRNVIATGNPWDVESFGVQATTSTSPSWQSSGATYSNGSTVTTTVPNTVIIAIVANAVDNGTAQTSAQAVNSLTSFNPEVSDYNGTAGTGGGFSFSIGNMVSVGTVVDTGSNNFTATLANTSKYAMAVIALKPVVTGPTAQQKAGFFQFLPQ